MRSRHRAFDRLGRWIADAVRLAPGRRGDALTFGTSSSRPAALSDASRSRHALMVRASAIVDQVESSPIVRTLDMTASNPQHNARITEFRVHVAGVSGVIAVASGPEGKLRPDILGLPMEVIGSDGRRFEAVCSGTSGDNDGPKIRFVFVPAPTESTTAVSISLAPFNAVGETHATLVLQASLA